MPLVFYPIDNCCGTRSKLGFLEGELINANSFFSVSIEFSIETFKFCYVTTKLLLVFIYLALLIP